MRRQMASRRAAIPALLAAVLLVLFSGTGLMAGTVISQFALAGPVPVGASKTPTGTAAGTATTAALGATHATATPTIASSQLVTTPFSLALSASPNPAQTTAPLQVTVRATADSTGEPLPGITCKLQAPDAGGTALLNSWPAPTVTDNTGAASWTLDISNITPGSYTIGVTSVGTSWSYHSQINITVTR